MKTILVYSLAAFYFLISLGLTANIHYCGGKLKKVSIVGFSEQKSCCAGKPMKKGCCKDVQVCLKKSSLEQKTHLAVLSFHAIVPDDLPVFALDLNPTILIPKKINASIHAPPQLGVPIHIQNCVFII